VVPLATDSVLIPSGESCLIRAAGSAAVAELVDVEGTLTIDAGRKRRPPRRRSTGAGS